MKGLYFTRKDELNQQPAHPQSDALKLLAKHGGLEVMHQQILRGASVWLAPMPGQDELEFFHICTGCVRLTHGDWTITLRQGDSFHTHELSDEVVLDILEDTDLLYISTMPVFDDNANYQSELMQLVRQINEKDHYTLQHSVNVRNYTIQLWKQFPQRQTCSFGDLVVAALFHDVGKCTISDDILKKPGRCTPEEYEIMKTHAAASGDLLRGHFPDKSAVIASQHHERLDGSGYPNHLSGDQLCFESRAIALADAFDAMTTTRVYSNPKSFEVAALELCGLPHLYDNELAQALLALVRSGDLVATKPVEF